MNKTQYLKTIIITAIAVISILVIFEVDFSHQKRCPYTNTEYKYLFTNEEDNNDDCSCNSFRNEISKLEQEIKDLEEENENYYCKLYPKKCKNDYKLTE